MGARQGRYVKTELIIGNALIFFVPEDWSKYDDEKVSPCKEDDILALCGGGDWHTAYMCYYKRLDKMPPPPKKKGKK